MFYIAETGEIQSEKLKSLAKGIRQHQLKEYVANSSLKHKLQLGGTLYHQGVFGKEVPAGYSGSTGWSAGVRSGRPSAEPAADGPDYKDSKGERFSMLKILKTMT